MATANVVKMDGYAQHEPKKAECEWDIIGNVFDNAIKRKKLSKEDVNNLLDKTKKRG